MQNQLCNLLATVQPLLWCCALISCGGFLPFFFFSPVHSVIFFICITLHSYLYNSYIDIDFFHYPPVAVTM